MPLLDTNLTIGAGENIFLTDPDLGRWGYEVAFGRIVNFTNFGNVSVSGDTGADGIVGMPVVGYYVPFPSSAGGLFWNKAGAVFRVEAYGGESDAFAMRGGATPDIINDGLVEVIGDVGAFGFYALNSAFTNNGALIVTAAGNALGVGFHGTVINTGIIEVSGNAIGVNLQDANSLLTNSGRITAISTGPFASVGVALFSASDSFHVMTNTAGGLIEGDFAVREIQPLVSPHLARQLIVNDGTLRGAVDLGIGDDEISNTGLIDGYVALGQGADLYGGGGMLIAPLFGGFGDDTIIGGAAGDDLRGEENDDSISGGAGADTLDGGHDRDTLDGGLDSDKLNGGYGDDLVLGGAGDDELDGWFGADTLEGGAGADTIVMSHAPQSSGATHDVIIGFDFQEDKIRVPGAPTTIDATIASGALAQLSFAHDLSVASSGRLSAGGAVLFSPSAGDYAGNLFLIVDANNVAGYQDGEDLVVRLQGAANVDQFSLTSFIEGPSFYERVPLEYNSSTLFGYYGGREIFSDFTIHAEESIQFDLESGTGIVSINLDSSPPISVENFGDIFVRTDATNGAVLGVVASGGFSNATSGRVHIEAIALDGTSSASGVSAIQIINDGTFEVFATGVSGGAVLPLGPNGLFNNTGLFHVIAGASAYGLLINDYTYKTAEFSNDGLFLVEAGDGALFAEGVNLVGVTQLFQNSGTIRVTETSNSTFSIAIAYANFLSDSVQTFENSGLIEAEWAIREKAHFTTQVTREVVVNSGIIRGSISVGDGADVVINSNLIVGRIYLGAGGDIYDGRTGELVGEVFGGAGNDTLSGGAGNDRLIGGAGADSLVGGLGIDAVSYADATGSVTIRLWNGTGTNNVASGDVLIGIENVGGGNFADNLVGANVTANWLGGGNGNDYLQGLSGNDTLVGGAGNDSLVGGSGADRHDFAPGAGADRIFNFISGAGVWDVIRITGYGAGLDSFAEILAHSVQVGADTVINLGGDKVTLVGVQKTSLVADDFLFG